MKNNNSLTKDIVQLLDSEDDNKLIMLIYNLLLASKEKKSS